MDDLKSSKRAATRTFIVTGGNTGLGFECASALAKDSGTSVMIACRDLEGVNKLRNACEKQMGTWRSCRLI